MKHANVSIFVAHVGCPNRCSFCNQHTISGSTQVPDGNFVRKTCKTALEQLKIPPSNAQIAFFGGSFTAVDRSLMLELLVAANEFIGENMFDSIRISTRPDCITPEILQILKQYHVKTIELGVQSMDDTVLLRNKRGHTSQHVITAAHMIKQYGFELGLQMMVGLYGDTAAGAVKTAEQLIALRPDCVRIYPVVVIRHTLLEQLYQTGKYQPMNCEDAIDVCAVLLKLFAENQIPVIRVGLHASELLEKDKVAGVYHPAFRELCESKLLLDEIFRQLREKKITPQEIVIKVRPQDRSRMVGNKKSNLLALQRMGYRVMIIEDENILPFQFEIGKKDDGICA